MRISGFTSLHILIIWALLIIFVILAFMYLKKPALSKQDIEDQAVLLSPVGLAAEADPDGWRLLFNGQTLDGWEITNFGPQGHININDSAIILNFGDGCTGITWEGDFPTTNYEITLQAMRISGNDFFCGLTFPVFDEHCTFIVGGWGGALIGISSIDGKDASENFTRKWMSFEDNQWYNVRVNVTGEAVTCFIDDNQIVNVPVKNHRFSVRPEVYLSKPLGICSWVTTAAVRNIRFRHTPAP